MTAIEIMMEEHRYIERMLNVVRKACFKVLQGEKVDYNDFDLMVEFITKYADGHHHNKEEIFLFNRMVENLGVLGEKTIKNGMLVEHDFGRLFVKGIKEALEKIKAGDEEAKLDLIGNSIAYTDLLRRHIDKEDNVIYKFALRELDEGIIEVVNRESISYEEENSSVKDRSVKILEELEQRY